MIFRDYQFLLVKMRVVGNAYLNAQRVSSGYVSLVRVFFFKL